MGKYRVLGNFFDRIYRNNLNANFDDVDADIQVQKKRVDDLITGVPQPSEVVDARGGAPVLRDRLDSVDAQLADKASKTEARLKATKIELEDLSTNTLGAMSGNATFNLLSIPQDGSVTPGKTTFAGTSIGKNKLDTNSGELRDSNWSIRFRVYIESGKTYRVGQKAGVSNCELSIRDSANAVLFSIQGFAPLSSGGVVFTPGLSTGWYYLYVRFPSAQATSYTAEWLVAINTVTFTTTDYVSYVETLTFNGFKLEADVPTDLINKINSTYKGKILLTYGDSVTAQATWQPSVVNKFGFSSYVNKGVGGRRLMTMATTTELNTITETFDIMLVMGGINDWIQDRAIGTPTDINTDAQAFTGTFYGGVRQLMINLTTKFPTKRIIFMTPTPVKMADGTKFFNGNGSADGYKNSNGNTIRDFAEVIIACGKEFHIPVIDLNAEVGWNDINKATYVLTETDGFIHPNTTGGIRMAECAIGGLRRYEPLS